MELINLKCSGCGSSIEATKTQVVEDGEQVIVRRDEVIVCEYCGNRYIVGDEIPLLVIERHTAFDQRGQQVGQQFNYCGDEKRLW